jgi:hypothetical protein
VEAGYQRYLSDAFSAALSLSTNWYGSWRTNLYDVSMAYQPSDAYRIALFSGTEAVPTQAALNARIVQQSNSLSAKVNPMPGAQFDASLFDNRVSDGNVRSGMYLDASMLVLPAAGIGVEARSRTFRDGVAGAATYFDPRRFSENDVLFSIRRRTGTWTLRVTAGIGRQTAVPGTSSTASLLRLQGAGRVAGCLTADASWLDSDSAVSSASGYRTGTVALSLSCAM